MTTRKNLAVAFSFRIALQRDFLN